MFSKIKGIVARVPESVLESVVREGPGDTEFRVEALWGE